MKKILAALLLASLLTLCGRPVMAGTKGIAPDEATRFAADYNALWNHAFKYFIRYRNKYGAAMRIRSMLQACDMGGLAGQVEGDLPDVAIFAGEQLRSDGDMGRDRTTLMSVALATQSLVTGYELGYLEAFKVEARGSPNCGLVAKVYDDYLKHKAK